MSRSSLWKIDKDFFGEEIKEYKNSWLLSPVAFNILETKYINHLLATPFGFKKSLMLDLDGSLFKELNNSINNCKNMNDRIVWEFCNQQVFLIKDKEVVSSAVKTFFEDNFKYFKNEENISIDEYDHIVERFNQVASDLLELGDDCEYFVFKNTSCDDGVECWFQKYDEEDEEYIDCSMKDSEYFKSEFVLINGDEMSFALGSEYFEEKGDSQ